MKQGLAIGRIELDPTLQDLSLSVFHATTHTFSNTPATKIVENHAGRAFIKSYVQQQIQQQQIIGKPIPKP